MAQTEVFGMAGGPVKLEEGGAPALNLGGPSDALGVGSRSIITQLPILANERSSSFAASGMLNLPDTLLSDPLAGLGGVNTSGGLLWPDDSVNTTVATGRGMWPAGSVVSPAFNVPSLSSGGAAGASLGASLDAPPAASARPPPPQQPETVLRHERLLSCKTYLKRLNVTQYMSDNLLPHTGAYRASSSSKHAARSYENLFKMDVRLVDPDGMAWTVQYEGVMCGAQRHLRLTSGWSEFIKAKSLAIGDSIIFERRGDQRSLLYVGFVRGDGTTQEVWQGEPKERTRRGGSDRRGLKQSGSRQQAALASVLEKGKADTSLAPIRAAGLVNSARASPDMLLADPAAGLFAGDGLADFHAPGSSGLGLGPWPGSDLASPLSGQLLPPQQQQLQQPHGQQLLLQQHLAPHQQPGLDQLAPPSAMASSGQWEVGASGLLFNPGAFRAPSPLGPLPGGDLLPLARPPGDGLAGTLPGLPALPRQSDSRQELLGQMEVLAQHRPDLLLSIVDAMMERRRAARVQHNALTQPATPSPTQK